MSKFLLRRLGVADDPSQNKPTLQGCLEAVLEQSDLLMQEVLGGLVSALVPVKDRVNPVLGDSTRAAITLLGERASEVNAAFANALRAAVFGGNIQRQVAQPLVRFDDFQFLEEEQIDANIESAMSQQDVLLAVEDVLPPLNALVSSLMGWSSVQAHLNPLRPESFVYALRESISPHLPADSAVVMTLASGRLGVSLRQLYQEICLWLKSQGVEPVPVSVAVPGSAVAHTLLTLDKLRSLLAGDLDPEPATLGGGDFMYTVPASLEALQDMKMVEPMLKRLVARGATNADPALADRSRSKALGQELGKEVVRLMLENLGRDARLLPRVRQSLQSLEPALLKLAQFDPRFFSDRQHPARQLMDKITHRGLAFTSDDDPAVEPFLAAFDRSVQTLGAGSCGAHSFARELRKLEDGWNREEQLQRQQAEEAARSLVRAEQRNLLAARLAADFTQRTLDKRVPEPVVAFLRGPWAQVVAEAQLGSAGATDDLSAFEALVDDLIWSVQVKLARRNRARLVHMVPGMLTRMRQGLQRIDYPQDRITAFFDELVTFHEKAFESVRSLPPGSRIENVVDRVQPLPQAEAGLPDDLWMAEAEAQDSGYFEEVAELSAHSAEFSTWPQDALTAGSWFDLDLGQGWVRAQLSWTSPHRTLFMFISGAGTAHSMSLRTLNRLSSQEKIRFVSDGRVIEQVLDAVAQAALVNDMRHAASGS